MNPFDLRGPEFLLFYALLSGVALVIQWWLRRDRERAQFAQPIPRLDDAYEIAYLRGGANETTRVAVVSLIHREVLNVVTDDILVTNPNAAEPSEFVEKSIFGFFREQSKSWQILKDSALRKSEEEEYEPRLVSKGLLLSPEQRERRFNDTLIVAGGLGAVAIIKIALALGRGHSNIFFLIAMAVGAIVVSIYLAQGRKTALGEQALQGMTTLFSGGARSETSSTQEVTMLAAVCGLPAVAAVGYPYARNMFRHTTPGASCGSAYVASTCGSSGSSCGSSSGGGDSGSGSSCGGGGSSCSSGSGCGGCGSS